MKSDKMLKQSKAFVAVMNFLIVIGLLVVVSYIGKYNHLVKDARYRGSEYYVTSSFHEKMDLLKQKFSDRAYNGTMKEVRDVMIQRDALCEEILQHLKNSSEDVQVYSPIWLIYHKGSSDIVTGVETPDPVVEIY